MSYPFSRNTHEGRRVERLGALGGERQAEIIQKSPFFDYANGVNDMVDSTIELSFFLSKIGLNYSDISSEVKRYVTELIQNPEAHLDPNLPQKELSEEDQKEYIKRVSDLVIALLQVKVSLPKLRLDEKDFTSDFNLALHKTLFLEYSLLTDKWRQTPELVDRYNSLFKVIQANPEWWDYWKYSIELTDDGIKFLDDRFKLALNNSGEKEWSESEALPSSNELEKIHRFILSAGEEYKSDLMKFLGLNNGKYWTNSKGGILLRGMSYTYTIETKLLSYAPQKDLYTVHEITRY